MRLAPATPPTAHAGSGDRLTAPVANGKLDQTYRSLTSAAFPEGAPRRCVS